jgi:hypothetical protein
MNFKSTKLKYEFKFLTRLPQVYLYSFINSIAEKSDHHDYKVYSSYFEPLRLTRGIPDDYKDKMVNCRLRYYDSTDDVFAEVKERKSSGELKKRSSKLSLKSKLSLFTQGSDVMAKSRMKEFDSRYKAFCISYDRKRWRDYKDRFEIILDSKVTLIDSIYNENHNNKILCRWPIIEIKSNDINFSMNNSLFSFLNKNTITKIISKRTLALQRLRNENLYAR